MKSFYPFEEISSLLRMTQQRQRILLLKNFPVYQQLSASTSSEGINCKAERKQTKRFKESRNSSSTRINVCSRKKENSITCGRFK
jgi:hypothetical protein